MRINSYGRVAKNVIPNFVLPSWRASFVFKLAHPAGYDHGIGIHEATQPPSVFEFCDCSFPAVFARLQETSARWKDRAAPTTIARGSASSDQPGDVAGS